MSEYPEHDKLAAVKEQSQALGEFLDFTLPRLGRGDGHVAICEYVPASDQPKWINPETGEERNLFDHDAVLNLDWHPEGYVPLGMHDRGHAGDPL
jgi:hypothetical protein